MQATLTDIDFIEEIRLRRWARENYRPAGDRNQDWHPVVLDEMLTKDTEVHSDRNDRNDDDLSSRSR
jgi:hypothetical protein